jgi:hypothetical protein
MLAFRPSLSHIAYYVKFNYYLISHIIGRVTHPLASLSSTSSSVDILIVFIIIDTASTSADYHGVHAESDVIFTESEAILAGSPYKSKHFVAELADSAWTLLGLVRVRTPSDSSD